MKKNRDIALTVCRTRFVDEKGNCLSVQSRFKSKFITFEELILENRFTVHAALVRKEVLDSEEPFYSEMKSLEDWDLWLRILQKGYKILCTNHILVNYFQISNAMSSNATIMYNVRMNILKKYFTAGSFSDNFKKKGLHRTEIWLLPASVSSIRLTLPVLVRLIYPLQVRHNKCK